MPVESMSGAGKFIDAQSHRSRTLIFPSRTNPERSQMFKFFKEYFAANPSDSSTSISLETLYLTNRVRVGEVKVFGGFADVYDGWLKGEGFFQQPIKVAVKVFRTYEGNVGDHDKVL